MEIIYLGGKYIMKKNNIKIVEKGKYREKCGDCYYNGRCTLLLKECVFKNKSIVFIK